MNSNIIKPEDINDWVERITPAQLHQALELAEANDVSTFLDYYYAGMFVIDFDWPHWDEGKQFFNTPYPEFHKIDEVFGYKLLTVIIRSDRFIEGALEHNIENGTVSSILERLIELKSESSRNKFRFQRKPRKCPVCSSKKIANYLYGMPDYSEELEKELEEGKTALAGCIVTEDCPVWVCFDCKTDFYKQQ